MKAREIRDLTTAELFTKLEEAYRELFNLRFQKATRQLTNHYRMSEVRHTIARIKTVARERELGEVAAVRAAERAEETVVGG